MHPSSVLFLGKNMASLGLSLLWLELRFGFSVLWIAHLGEHAGVRGYLLLAVLECFGMHALWFELHLKRGLFLVSRERVCALSCGLDRECECTR